MTGTSRARRYCEAAKVELRDERKVFSETWNDEMGDVRGAWEGAPGNENLRKPREKFPLERLPNVPQVFHLPRNFCLMIGQRLHRDDTREIRSTRSFNPNRSPVNECADSGNAAEFVAGDRDEVWCINFRKV